VWKALEKKRAISGYIIVINDMYEGASTNVRTHDGASDNFYTTIGLHQGSTLNPYLFTLVLNLLTKHI